MSKRFLRLSEVEERVSLTYGTIYPMMAAGKFPKNFRISAGRVAWLESDITAWQDDRLREAGLIEKVA